MTRRTIWCLAFALAVFTTLIGDSLLTIAIGPWPWEPQEFFLDKPMLQSGPRNAHSDHVDYNVFRDEDLSRIPYESWDAFNDTETQQEFADRYARLQHHQLIIDRLNPEQRPPSECWRIVDPLAGLYTHWLTIEGIRNPQIRLVAIPAIALFRTTWYAFLLWAGSRIWKMTYSALRFLSKSRLVMTLWRNTKLCGEKVREKVRWWLIPE